MVEQIKDPAATPNPAEVQDPNLLKEAGAAGDKTVFSEAAEQQKQAQEAEEKRLLDADLATLNDADKVKRANLEKVKEEKRLLDTPKEQLSAEDQVKQAKLIETKAAEAKAKEVPEKYEIKVPEGMTLDQAFVDELIPVFKELKITQAGAQKLADLYTKKLQANADAQAADFKKFLKDSYDETVTALGAKYKEELAYVAKVRDMFLSEETREMLDASGLSNNKAFILDLVKLGKLISEDKLVGGRNQIPSGIKTPADILYPEQGKTQN